MCGNSCEIFAWQKQRVRLRSTQPLRWICQATGMDTSYPTGGLEMTDGESGRELLGGLDSRRFARGHSKCARSKIQV